MRSLADRLGWVPAEERRGIHIDTERPTWEVDSSETFEQLFRALDGWLPGGCTLYFEGGSPSPEIEAFMAAHAVPERAHLAMGTIWPRPLIFHVPASREMFERLTRLADHHAAPELAVHFHVYRGDEVLLEAYDLFAQEMWLPGSLSDDRVEDLAKRLGVGFRKTER